VICTQAFLRARNDRFHDSDILRLAFERVVEARITAEFVDGRGFAGREPDRRGCQQTTINSK
jgi:hypothetical protein